MDRSLYLLIHLSVYVSASVHEVVSLSLFVFVVCLLLGSTSCSSTNSPQRWCSSPGRFLVARVVHAKTRTSVGAPQPGACYPAFETKRSPCYALGQQPRNPVAEGRPHPHAMFQRNFPVRARQGPTEELSECHVVGVKGATAHARGPLTT